MATYAIGDIQGCYDAFLALLKKLKFREDCDELWLAGDFVNRGPQSLEMLRWMLKHRAQVVGVLGNHDLHLLAVAHGIGKLKRKDTLEAILEAKDREALIAMLLEFGVVHWDEKRAIFLSHAGLPPRFSVQEALQLSGELGSVLSDERRRIEYFKIMYSSEALYLKDAPNELIRARVITDYFTRMRFTTEDGGLDFRHKGAAESASSEGVLLGSSARDNQWRPWFEWEPARFNSFRVLFGHWAALEGKTGNPSLIALDTGCVWGGTLTAYNVDSRELIAVPGLAVEQNWE